MFKLCKNLKSKTFTTQIVTKNKNLKCNKTQYLTKLQKSILVRKTGHLDNQ